jgi:hypothetical protein
MWLGPVLFVRTLVLVIFFILVYWLYYERIMFAEEQFLRGKFGDVYDKYSEKVRAIIPRIRGFVKPALPFSFKSVLRREHNSFVNIFILFVLLDLFRNFFLSERIYLTPMWIYIGVVAGLIWVMIRLIHKRTSWLNDEGR